MIDDTKLYDIIINRRYNLSWRRLDLLSLTYS